MLNQLKNNDMKIKLIILFLSFSNLIWAQTQTIKGNVIDKDTKTPLIGATVSIMDIDPPLGVITDENGNFEILEVPVGRHKISCQYLGYESFLSDNTIVNSAKELVLNIELLEASFTTDEVVVTALKHGSEPLNELSIVSTRSFSVEETQRYAASANDPGRMAMGFPGVQPSRDTRSDIVIRGNSAAGMLWRVEGIDIPNPNHFARIGSSGGGITIFSSSMLSNSDFSTGAFPAEYGNAFSGVFDMKFRKGNKNKRESTFKAGILGLDFSTEGPISKGKSSYLVNYRYSTLGILNKIGLHLVGERIDNTFQDLSFNLSFPSINGKVITNVWGIGGLSTEIGSTTKGVENWKSYSDQTAYNFVTNMGAIGVNSTFLLNEKSYLKISLAGMGQKVIYDQDTVNTSLVHYNYRNQKYINNRFTINTTYNYKFNPQLSMKTGVIGTNIWYNVREDSISTVFPQYPKLVRRAGDGYTYLHQTYIQFRYKPHHQWNINLGVHGMFFLLNKTQSIEPRLGIKYTISKHQNISFAYGLHSRIVPIGTYFTVAYDENLNPIGQPNKNLELIKSHHFVLAYDFLLGNNFRFHTEIYQQNLFDVPVSARNNFSSYWILNDVDHYANEALTSDGIGKNIGIDISFEKLFNKGAFFILSTSLFDSKYKMSKESTTWYNTQYNSNVSATFIGGKEWAVRNNGTIQIGLKMLYNGGQRLTPLLENVGDINQKNPPLDYARPFEEKVKAYFRPDLRIAYRKDNLKTAWNIALDIQNVIARKNIDGLNRTYDPELHQWVYRNQSSLVPLISFQIDF